MKHTLAVPACALLLALAPATLARDPMVTDRPDTTNSASVVPSGVWQVETGLLSSTDDDGADVDILQLLGTLARFGLSDQLELRVGFDGFIDIDVGPFDVDGAGDTSVGVKFALAEERGRRPQIALEVGTSLPTGDDEIGSPRADPFAVAAFSSTLSDTVSVGYNAGFKASSFERSGGDEETDVVALGSVSLGFAVNDRVGAFVEMFGSAIVSDGEDTPVALDGGVTWKVNPDLQLDAFAGVGLSSDAEDFFLGFGVSFRGGR